ncbi:PREDICTED: helicase and polymerase-containing protein TEBICHI-like isoform X2 [Camelina sativa]|uniref:Helicase and polymerase-containing protein TEBICHI-like isoform X2 n=1 Tax=Camelina sativa TaxID=90675 RepID=A0ABM1QSI8_CAMSA|nr:PREDICTED: helicase and polymerase-containing protein TEBICHI-like isoform X2 [Camelina sativa]
MQSLQEKASVLSGVDQAEAFAIDESNLFEKLGLQTFINLSTNFYTRVYDDEEEWFRSIFSDSNKEDAIQNQYEFFVQRMGGPPLFSQRKGFFFSRSPAVTLLSPPMDSGSSKSRIDQFFNSKKRKHSSPNLKSGRNEKNVKVTGEKSPGDKGTLDNYLKASLDDKSTFNSGLQARQEAFTRKLDMEVSASSAGENIRPCVPKPVWLATSKGVEGCLNQNGSQDLHKEGVATTEAHATDDFLCASQKDKSELRDFATGFLSLYCSGMQSVIGSPSHQKACELKRQSSSSSPSKDIKISHKRRCDSQIIPSLDELAYPLGSKPESLASIADKRVKSVSDPTKKIPSTELIEIPMGLRKCTKAPESSAHLTECHTPGSAVKSCPVGTPKSGSGSSMFSPGDSFWNEAIQVADGLKIPFEQSGSVEAKNGSQHGTILLCSNKTDTCSEKLKRSLDIDESRVKDKEAIGFSKVVETHGRDFNKEASPLPVKNLELLFQDKKTNGGCLDIANNAQADNISIGRVYPESERNKVLLCEENHSERSVSMIGNLRKSVDSSESEESHTPSSSHRNKDGLNLSTWLPSEVCSVYNKKGISKLYPWQVECLQVDGVLQKRNLVYCASTSAGKSFVAEVLMLRRVITTGKMALLVLPYVSICAEKAEHLEVLLEPLGKHVRSYYGNQGGGTLPKGTSVAVCTIEKANSLINRLLEEGRLSELGIIVIDELHMVGDQHRGYLLELMLTKLRYAAGEGSSESSSGESSGNSSGKADPAHGLQIVGMSATMPNVGAVADWLQAALYQTEFRPVPLEEYIKVGSTVYNKKMEVVRTIPKVADMGGKDPDHIVELCNEVVQEGNSVLIFCSSRKGCESTARHISKLIKKVPVDVDGENSEFMDIGSAIDALRRSPSGVDPVLEETLPSGVAYHHAGLTVEEREIVETCYRKGLVRVLTATSTLAAGVNLPARRVIFRQPMIGRDFIDGTRYKQMSGRAGRTGIDTKGESVLICKPGELKRIMALLNETCPPLQSCLSEDKNGMTHAILEVVAGGIVQTAKDIHRYVRCTLLNSTKPFQDVVKSAQDSLRWLCHRKFLEWNEETKLYTATPLGRGSFGSSLCPEESLIVLDDLLRAREGLVMASDLHLVYLVTPINVGVEPNWELYYERFMELSPLEQSVGNRVGVVEPFLMRMAHGATVRTRNRSQDVKNNFRGEYDNQLGSTSMKMLSDEQMLRVCKRFFVALILSKLVQEASVTEVCEAFKVARGMVQALQENAGRFSSMVSVFCERLGWHDLEGLVAKFQNRVSFGVRAEIVELTSIPYIKGSRARALYKAGLRTSQAIAEASIPEIVKALFESSAWAEEGTGQRKIHLGLAKKIKNGARKIVLEKAEEARAAAFSAFKSLGLDVHELSKPLPSAPAMSPNGKQTTERDNSRGSVGPDGVRHVPGRLSIEGHMECETFDTDNHREKPRVVLGVSSEVNLTSHLPNLQPIGTTVGTNGPSAVGILSSDTSPIPVYDDREIKTEDNVDQHLTRNSHITLSNKDGTGEKGPITAGNISGGFDSFLELWESAGEFFFDIHYNKLQNLNSRISYEIHGIAICWNSSPVYYVNLNKDLPNLECVEKQKLIEEDAVVGKKEVFATHNMFDVIKSRWNRISKIMGNVSTRKFTWNLKVQIQVLKSPAISIQRCTRLNHAEGIRDLELVDGSWLMMPPLHISQTIDMSIVTWILWPDEERHSNPNIEKEVKKRLSPEAAEAANRSGRWRNQIRRVAHNGCCRRVAQTRALCSALWKILVSEELIEALTTTEMPLVNVLADMELWGIGVDTEGCLKARNILRDKLRSLEKKAFELAGMTFSLHNPADIANVLFGQLKLPIPENQSKGKLHPSTDKHCLDLLRNVHPVVPIIKEHRTLAKLLNCTLGSICSLAKLRLSTQRYTLHGRWLQTSTATGRVSIEEPNLQSVEHEVEFILDNHGKDVNSNADRYKINARDFFVPTQENWLLLTADYSQIELRLMAHFSRDSSLISQLSQPEGDVFTMIAAKWTGKAEGSVSPHDRDQTKRLIYGILYGMGANRLAEQLECSSDEAKEKIRSFKNSFPAVTSWLNETISFCQEKGYIQTLKGRRRFLSKIKFGNAKEKSKAQRQAVNSMCQGSAADIIKIAMINIYSAIADDVGTAISSSSTESRFHMLKERCRILLQVHDELVLEVDPLYVKEAAILLQTSMENAVSLLVPLHVKVKVGKTWGSLQPFQAD